MRKTIAMWVLTVTAALGSQAQVAEPQDSLIDCGPKGVTLEIQRDKKQHPLPKPASGEGLLYVLGLDNRNIYLKISTLGFVRDNVAGVAIDGHWAAAVGMKTYTFIPLKPGTHRICSMPMTMKAGMKPHFMYLTVEAGKTYYFQQLGGQGSFSMGLRVIEDETQAQHLLSIATYCTWRQKEKAR